MGIRGGITDPLRSEFSYGIGPERKFARHLADRRDVTGVSIRLGRRQPALEVRRHMNIIEATRSYESWMAEHTSVVRGDLRRKHELLAQSPFVFLRGTFYRWVQVWPTVCPSLVDAPRVLAVGDLHVENFGTWRDAEGRLVWGVNDLDEASPLPYTSDLVRLATSAVLAGEEEHIAVSIRRICASILDGYVTSLERGGRPIVLAERHAWLRQIAVNELKDPVKFWEGIFENPRAPNVPESMMRLLALPKGCSDIQMFRRQAGVGSLGRPRFVALVMYQGGLIAREGKALIPPAADWASAAKRPRSYGVELSRRAVRAPDPFFNNDAHWTVRRLSPDCLKIEVDDLPRGRDDRLLRAMGWETANIHLGTPRMQAKKDVGGRSSRWLERATNDMVAALVDEHREWRRQYRRARGRARGRRSRHPAPS